MDIKFESNASVVADRVGVGVNELKNDALKTERESVKGIQSIWYAISPVYAGEYSYPNEFGYPHGRGGTLRKSITYYSNPEWYNNDSEGIYTGLIEVTGARNRRNWFDGKDYASNFKPLFDVMMDNSEDTLYSSFKNEALQDIARIFNG